MSKNPRHLRPPIISIPRVLGIFADTFRKVTCLQIGANDGRSNDPIHRFIIANKWRAVLVEPQERVFNEGLKKTYAGVDHVMLERGAVAATDGELEIYKIAFSNKRWATGLTGFNRRVLEHHVEMGYVDQMAREHGETPPANKTEYISTEKVPTHPPAYYLTKNGLKTLDVLCIDTEGFDFEVLKMMDWKTFHPKVVLFESKHLSDTDFVAAQKYLRDLGYEVFWQKGDTLALDPALVRHLGLRRHLLQLQGFLEKL